MIFFVIKKIKTSDFFRQSPIVKPLFSKPMLTRSMWIDLLMMIW
jgi:hypothetical protein